VTLLELALYFGLLSLISVGGMPAVMPELQRYVVDVKGWLTPGEFLQAFAVGQAAPGPNILIASLIGWKVAGIPGAIVALAAICGPAAVIAWWVAELWERFKDSPWRKAIQKAISPIVVALILSSGVIIATPGAPDWRMWLIAGASAAAMLATKVNPLWMLGGGGVLGVYCFDSVGWPSLFHQSRPPISSFTRKPSSAILSAPLVEALQPMPSQ
jgi:chromate transporter